MKLLIGLLLVSSTVFSGEICVLKVMERGQSPSEMTRHLKCSSEKEAAEVRSECVGAMNPKGNALVCLKNLLGRGYKLEKTDYLQTAGGDIVGQHMLIRR